MHDSWIAERTGAIDVSSIRKVMELAAKLKDPVNLSIGLPDFPVPEPIKAATHQAIDDDRNAYTVTLGLPELRSKIQAEARRLYPSHPDRQVIITCGTSGGLTLALLCTINPGDEVIVFDPYFVMYPQFVSMVGGKVVIIDTYPDFQIDVDRVRAAVTPRTKAIIVNSPANPTGVVHSRERMKDLAQLALKHNILLLSDEVYRMFSFDRPFSSPAEFNEDVLVFDGFSKGYAMTGWRLGWCHGPHALIEEMAKLQQMTFVCAPSMAQWGGLAALDVDMSGVAAEYKKKRDRMAVALKKGGYEIAGAEGAFYLFPRVPQGSGSDFVAEAMRRNLLLLPGSIFSRRDTHFRLSYAASDAVLQRGIEILQKM